MNKFKVGSEVRWNGRMDSASLWFWSNMEKILKSKKIHIIERIYNGNSCTLEGIDNLFDLKWFDLVEEPKTKKQHKLKVLEEHKKWLEYQLEEVLNGTEWVSSKDNRKYKINSNTSTDVALMMANGYSLVLELKKELTRVKLAIINLE